MVFIEEGKIYTAWTLIEKAGRIYGHFVVDVQKENNVVYAVLEWENMHDGEIPVYRLPIDARLLSELNWPKAQFLYEGRGVVVPPDAPDHIPSIPHE